MTAAQARIADTLETFYGAADRASEGAMAGHAYKRSVDDLDSSFSRELVRVNYLLTHIILLISRTGPIVLQFLSH